ncbi:hypothetical protein ACHAXR_002925, partial [Thalassiosira sp. AJA248-18]
MKSMSSDNAQEICKGSNDGSNGDDGPATLAAEPVIAIAADADTSTPSGLKKKKHKKRKASKGRLKKLWRRAVGVPPGISARSEWVELVELHSDWKAHHADSNADDQNEGGGKIDKRSGGGGVATDYEAMLGPLPGPSVLLATKQRDFSELENWQITEGTDHRDVLMNLLFSDGAVGHNSSTQNEKKKKKRKLNKDAKSENGNEINRHGIHVPPLPSWSNIGNLGSVGGVAVIQIEIIGGERDRACPLMPSQRIMDTANTKSVNVWSSLVQSNSSKEPNCSNDNNTAKRTIGAAYKVKLFQGNKQPRCLSNVLMMLPPCPSEIGTKRQNGCLFRAMNDLLLKQKQLRSEGFPMQSNEVSEETIDAKIARARICKMSGTTLSVTDLQNTADYDALEMITALSINAVLGDSAQEEDGTEKEDGFSKMEHYVRTGSLDRAVNGAASHSNEKAQTQRPRIFSIDCEMVKTSAGPELARVSVILFTGGNGDGGKNDATNPEAEEKSIVVLDELVKPRRKVLDYLTEYSGITPKMLHDQELGTRIEHIQVCLLSMIHENDIIVGHSVENDLRALRLVHKNVIDTSVIFRGINGRKFSLRHLSNVLLQKKIQQGCGSSGHCSTEDAEAALL